MVKNDLHNSWQEYQRLVLKELEENKRKIEKLEEVVNGLKTKHAVLTTKISIYSIMAASVATIFLQIFTRFIHFSF